MSTDGVSTGLEEALVTWLFKKASRGVQVNGSLLCMHAKKLIIEANKIVDDEGKINLTLSKGWISRFQQLPSFKMQRVQGEASKKRTLR